MRERGWVLADADGNVIAYHIGAPISPPGAQSNKYPTLDGTQVREIPVEMAREIASRGIDIEETREEAEETREDLEPIRRYRLQREDEGSSVIERTESEIEGRG